MNRRWLEQTDYNTVITQHTFDTKQAPPHRLGWRTFPHPSSSHRYTGRSSPEWCMFAPLCKCHPSLVTNTTYLTTRPSQNHSQQPSVSNRMHLGTNLGMMIPGSLLVHGVTSQNPVCPCKRSTTPAQYQHAPSTRPWAPQAAPSPHSAVPPPFLRGHLTTSCTSTSVTWVLGQSTLAKPWSNPGQIPSACSS